MRRVLFVILGFGIVLIQAAPALAFNTQLTVYASVPEQRIIYIDESGIIYKIAGNTKNNISPIIYDYKNQPIAITDAIQKQYDSFLSLHHGRLEASKIYKVNPITVNNTADSQTIRVDGGLKLGSI